MLFIKAISGQEGTPSDLFLTVENPVLRWASRKALSARPLEIREALALKGWYQITGYNRGSTPPAHYLGGSARAVKQAGSLSNIMFVARRLTVCVRASDRVWARECGLSSLSQDAQCDCFLAPCNCSPLWNCCSMPESIYKCQISPLLLLQLMSKNNTSPNL